MGFAALSGKAGKMPGQEIGRQLWDRTFGTNKEDQHKQTPTSRPNPIPGGTFGRSITSTESAFKKLLLAMRSMAPGGWSDDRYEETRHFIGIPYVAIHRIATMWSQSIFSLYRKDDNHPDGKIPITKDDPAYRMIELLEKPNKQDSFGQLMYRWCQQKYLTGTALTWLIPNMNGTPVEMYCIPTAIAIPQPAVNPDFPDGFYRIQPLYPYGPFSSYPTPASAVGAPIPAQWMMRFQFPHPLLRYEGYSPLTGLNLHIDAIEMIDASRQSSMRRAINPSAVVNMKEMEGQQPLPATEIDRIIAEFEAAFMGPQNQGHLMIAPPGGEIVPWGTAPIEMGYREGWDQLSSFIFGGLGITKPVAGMSEDSSYSTLYASLKQFYFQELEPGLDAVAADLTRHLATYFGDDLILEIKGKQINDHDIAFSKIEKGMSAKCITKNQVLKLLDLPVTTEEWGEEIAGTDSPEEQQAAMMQQQGVEGQEEQPMEQEQPAEEQPVEDTDLSDLDALFGGDEEEAELEEDRESPEGLSEGSLGPRKYLGRRGTNGKHLNGHSKRLTDATITNLLKRVKAIK